MKNECEGIPDYLLELPDTSKLQLSFQIVYEQNKTLQRLEQLESSENVNPDAKIFIKSKCSGSYDRCFDDRLPALLDARGIRPSENNRPDLFGRFSMTPST